MFFMSNFLGTAGTLSRCCNETLAFEEVHRHRPGARALPIRKVTDAPKLHFRNRFVNMVKVNTFDLPSGMFDILVFSREVRHDSECAKVS